MNTYEFGIRSDCIASDGRSCNKTVRRDLKTAQLTGLHTDTVSVMTGTLGIRDRFNT